jgi:Tfp pilus assembly protein PilN
MIKVNLLEGAADMRAATRATKVATKTTQQLLMAVSGLVVMLLAIGGDYYLANNKLQEAEKRLAEQKRIAEDFKKNREKKEILENQIKAIEERIKIIEDLEKTQKGPSAMLNLINSKKPGAILLEKIVQKGPALTITGLSEREEAISEFARGMELGSNGLFQGVTFSVAREEGPEKDPADPEKKRLLVKYRFTIRTAYLPTEVGKAPAEGAAGAPAAGGQPAVN